MRAAIVVAWYMLWFVSWDGLVKYSAVCTCVYVCAFFAFRGFFLVVDNR